jgi:hypothetical protein
MSDPKNPSSWTPPRTWLLKQISAVTAKQSALTVDGWDERGRSLSLPEFAKRRAELKTQRAAAEIIAALVTIAVRGLSPSTTVDQLAAQAWRTNGFEVRPGPAIIAAIIAGYEPLPDEFGSGGTFPKRVSW